MSHVMGRIHVSGQVAFLRLIQAPNHSPMTLQVISKEQHTKFLILSPRTHIFHLTQLARAHHVASHWAVRLWLCGGNCRLLIAGWSYERERQILSECANEVPVSVCGIWKLKEWQQGRIALTVTKHLICTGFRKPRTSKLYSE